MTDYEYGIDGLGNPGDVNPMPGLTLEELRKYAAGFYPPRKIFRRPVPAWEEVPLDGRTRQEPRWKWGDPEEPVALEDIRARRGPITYPATPQEELARTAVDSYADYRENGPEEARGYNGRGYCIEHGPLVGSSQDMSPEEVLEEHRANPRMHGKRRDV